MQEVQRVLSESVWQTSFSFTGELCICMSTLTPRVAKRVRHPHLLVALRCPQYLHTSVGGLGQEPREGPRMGQKELAGLSIGQSTLTYIYVWLTKVLFLKTARIQKSLRAPSLNQLFWGLNAWYRTSVQCPQFDRMVPSKTAPKRQDLTHMARKNWWRRAFLKTSHSFSSCIF